MRRMDVMASPLRNSLRQSWRSANAPIIRSRNTLSHSQKFFVKSVEGKAPSLSQVSNPQQHSRWTDAPGISTTSTWLWQGVSVAVLATAAFVALEAVQPNYVEMEQGAVMTESVCDTSVSVWQRKGRLIYLLGSDTSYHSAKLAGDLVKDVRPQAVFVELDLQSVLLGLAGSIHFATTTKDQGVHDVRTIHGPLPVVGLPPQKVLISTSQLLGTEDSLVPPFKPTAKQLQFRAPEIQGFDLHSWNYCNERVIQFCHHHKAESAHPRGDAFVNAMKEGLNVEAFIVLGDRDAQITQSRSDLAWDATEWVFSIEELNAVKKYLQSDHNGTLEAKEMARRKVRLLKRNAPLVYRAVLEERDEFMALGLDSLGQFRTVVAVTGTAHVLGVGRNLLALGWKPIPKSCPMPHKD